MAIPRLDPPAFSFGEVTPELFGRYDLTRMSVAASTMRNMFARVSGGAMSRAGTMFVNFSKQTGRSYKPRLVPFQFSLSQGLSLEFGNNYMRVIKNGAFVTEAPLSISGISQHDPAVVSSNGSGITAATPIVTGVVSTYAPADTVTIAGGTYLTQAVLAVTNTKLVSLLLDSPGSGVYAPADTIDLAGGTHTTTAVVTVNTTQVVSATIAAAGAAGTPGAAVVTGTTGTGTKFQANVTIDGGGALASVDSIAVAGSYSANPTAPANEPVTGGGLAGAQLNVSLGVLTFTIFNAGVFTANAAGGNFTQAATSGSGTGATFQQGIFGPNACSVSTPGVYTVVPTNPASQDSSSGGGLGATFTLTSASVAAFNANDWVQISGVAGMTEVNGQTYVVKNPTSTNFELYDVYGNTVDSTGFTAYSSGGTVARIYTATSPYGEADLAYLKWAQDKDVMSLCCVNQETLTEYPSYELSRLADNNWSFDVLDVSPGVSPPTGVSGSASSAGSTFYQYVVTSINPDDGTESIASAIASIGSAVNISATAGTITLSWTPAAGVSQQNVYKALPAFSAYPPAGSLFGFAGYAFGAQFKDSNITADFAQVPPLHKDPFARGQVTAATTVTAGTGYTAAAVSITTATGSGASIEAIVVSGGVVAFIIHAAGQNYASTDTISISGDGTGATALLTVGAASGTYPSVVSYFQQRRAYGNSLNFPDTYWMSQPGAFTNFDSRIPTIQSDAITGSPWSSKVDGIQWMINTAGGLLVFTGIANWLLVGTGSFATNVQAIAPDAQTATPQPENGCSATVPPIKINYDVIYASVNGYYFDQPYELYALSEPIDLTPDSSHLFIGHSIVEHAWCQEPYRLVWGVRDDGILLSLAWLKQQGVHAFTRHDTNGAVRSVCSIKEPPVDALYLACERQFGNNTAYTIERMDNRIWEKTDDAWCVDCGLSLTKTYPAANLTISSATGTGAIASAVIGSGGTGYTAATTATVVDDNGYGSGAGAVLALTIVAGVITGCAVSAAGSGYSRPAVVISDPAGSAGGSGASITLTLANTVTLTASAAVFALGNVGDVVEGAGGKATITAFGSTTSVTANVTVPFTDLVPNSGGRVVPQVSGDWSMTTPVSTVGGLQYAAGATFTGVADGVQITPQVVPASGIINLPQASTNVVAGMGFAAQLQSVYIDAGEPTIQGQRKNIPAVTARVASSADFEMGANQRDGSTYNPLQIAPPWSDMATATVQSQAPYGSTVKPLYTGDVRIPLKGGFNIKGQVAVQQTGPWPLEVLAFVPEVDPGDIPEKGFPKEGGR